MLVGDAPILRFDSSGSASRVYYLEDGIGSVIGLAPDGSPTTNNTTRLFYSGFGSLRGTNGPAPSVPTGTGGDFRFQGQWWESATDFYHLRARDYDTRTGRFLSRDPDEGEFEQPETLNPYGYALLNPFVYSDPSGKETLIELNVVPLLQSSIQALKQVAVNEAKNYIKNKVFDAFINVALKQLASLSPEVGALLDSLGAKDLEEAGREFEKRVLKAVCKIDAVKDVLYIEPSVAADGTPARDGLNCAQKHGKKKLKGWSKRGAARPDFILSQIPPTELAGKQAIVVGDIKLNANRLYINYVARGKTKQLDAIANFANRFTETQSAVFISVLRGNEGNFQRLKRTLIGNGLKKRVFLWVYSAQPSRKGRK